MSGSAGCSPHPAGSGIALFGVILLLVAVIVVLARSYPRNLRRLVARVGFLLASVVAPVGLVVSFAIPMLAHRDPCGQVPRHAASWGAGVLIATVVLEIAGLALLTATEWVPMLFIVVIDIYEVGIAFVGLAGQQARVVTVLYGTHAACTAVASWWSWRARGRGPSARAKASEAGRLLSGGQAALVLLEVASSGQVKSNPVLTNSNLGTLLIGTARAVALGTGFTKYVEAMDPPLVGDQPRSNLPARLRSGRTAIARQYRTIHRSARRPRRAAAAQHRSPSDPTPPHREASTTELAQDGDSWECPPPPCPPRSTSPEDRPPWNG
jgi:hypothetical protein